MSLKKNNPQARRAGDVTQVAQSLRIQTPIPPKEKKGEHSNAMFGFLRGP
jgi:hypothetical protein